MRDNLPKERSEREKESYSSLIVFSMKERNEDQNLLSCLVEILFSRKEKKMKKKKINCSITIVLLEWKFLPKIKFS